MGDAFWGTFKPKSYLIQPLQVVCNEFQLNKASSQAPTA